MSAALAQKSLFFTLFDDDGDTIARKLKCARNSGGDTNRRNAPQVSGLALIRGEQRVGKHGRNWEGFWVNLSAGDVNLFCES